MKHILNKTAAYALAVAMAIALLPAAYGADLAEAEPSDVPEVTAVEPVEATETDTAPVAEPEPSPALFGGGPDTSTVITGAPSDLTVDYTSGYSAINYSWTNNPSAQVNAQGVRVVISSDGGETWEVIKEVNYKYGASYKSVNSDSYSGLEHRKNYYCKVFYFDSTDKEGPDSNVVGPIECLIESELKKETAEKIKDAAAQKGSYNYTNYNEQRLSKGSKAVFDRGLYKLTLEVTKVSGTKITFKGTVKNKFPEDLQVYCDSVSWIKSLSAKSSNVSISKDSTFTCTADLSEMAQGCNYLKFYMEVNGGYASGDYDSSETLYLNVNPNGNSLSLNNAYANKNTISLGQAFTGDSNTTDSGTVVYYRKKGAKKWSKKTFAKGKSMKLSKLSANTVYQFQTQNYIKSKKKGGYLDKKGTVITNYSDKSNTLSVRTAMAKAPAIKSIKVSKVKVIKTHLKASVFWNGYKWVYTPARDSYSTSYKMTVTLKSNGSKGLMITNTDRSRTGAHFFKGSGKTFTISGTFNGKMKGKKVKMKFATCNDAAAYYNTGISSYVTKSIKLK